MAKVLFIAGEALFKRIEDNMNLNTKKWQVIIETNGVSI
jgi:hypothetical protein